METVIHLMDKRIERIKTDIRNHITETRAQTDEIVSNIDIMQANNRARNADMHRKKFKSIEGGKT